MIRRTFLRLDGLYPVRLLMAWAVFVVFGLFLTGCGRVDSVSEVRGDGTWTKTVTVTVGKQGEGVGDKIDVEKLVLGHGDGWTGERKDTESDEVYVLTKTFAAGESAEVEIQSHGKGMARSVGTWSDGEFKEVWTWTGKDMGDEMKKGRERIGDALKSASAELTDQVRLAVGTKVADRMWREIYGPGRPLVAMLLHPQVMEREFKLRAYRIMVEELKSAGVDGAESIAKSAARTAFLDDMGVKTSPPESEEDADDSGLISVNVVVRHGSGSVSETNGDLNPVDDTAEWSFYPQSAAVGPLELTAKFK